MTRVREEVTIAAPAEKVWQVVHEDLRSASKWNPQLKRATPVGDHTGKGARVRYDLQLPGWSGSLEVEHTTWRPGKKAAGRFTDGPLKGTWSYTYSERASATRLVYEMDYQMGGLLRFAGGLLAAQYAAGIAEALRRLKKYVESKK
ncbi:MAG TPA: SRPBCC family protein [Candidatus Dormibacteraeota bacterium]